MEIGLKGRGELSHILERKLATRWEGGLKKEEKSKLIYGLSDLGLGDPKRLVLLAGPGG